MSVPYIRMFVLEKKLDYVADHYTWLGGYNPERGMFFAKSNRTDNFKWFTTLGELRSFKQWALRQGFTIRCEWEVAIAG